MTSPIVARCGASEAGRSHKPASAGSTPAPASTATGPFVVFRIQGRAAVVFRAIANLARRVGGAA